MAGQLSNIESQAITLEQLHTDVMTGSLAADDQSAGSSTMQRSFVALLTVASHSNTGRLALDQPGSASGRQLILSAHMEAGGVRASFATAP
ncbi:hypothetical protein WJX84_010485 [Apatococcus fuscideae]|uniref:Uncharacterized protein n=1 Tax=Apatococcus fuscideae TaxID=2026836 RepID=A0AAW1SZY7_9CHLO